MISTESCKQSKLTKYGLVSDNAICVLDTDGRQRSACHGDSGGPMMCGNCGHNIQAGITSWGEVGICSGTMPVVYTSVAKYRDWIREHSGV